MKSPAARALPAAWRSLFLVALLMTACGEERGRVSVGPTEPYQPPDVTGSYEATHLIVERDGHFTELIGEPDTRLSLTLNGDGSARGQLKIGPDPELPSKQSLVGTWRLSVPNRVTFDFSEPTFIEQIAFEIVHNGLVGYWAGEGVSVKIELERVG